MLPACLIIINYTQERSWNREKTAKRGEQERRRNRGNLFTESPDITVSALYQFFWLVNSWDFSEATQLFTLALPYSLSTSKRETHQYATIMQQWPEKSSLSLHNSTTFQIM